MDMFLGRAVSLYLPAMPVEAGQESKEVECAKCNKLVRVAKESVLPEGHAYLCPKDWKWFSRMALARAKGFSLGV